MTFLFDYDSLIYTSAYRIVDIEKIRKWIGAGKPRSWMEQEIVQHSINRLEQSGNLIFDAIENDTGVEMTAVEYFITSAKNPMRNKISSIYKENRRKKVNPMKKWVNMVRTELLNGGFVNTSDIWEADDLIADRAKEIGFYDCVIVSVDKDLQQIPGLHYDIYREKVKDSEGNYLLDEYGQIKKRYRGQKVVEKEDADYSFWIQVLMGDNVDNIKGLPKVGKVKANRILYGAEPTEYEDRVKKAYMSHYGDLDEYYKNYQLIYLGTDQKTRASYCEEVLKQTA